MTDARASKLIGTLLALWVGLGNALASDPPLIDAVRRGDANALRRLIDEGTGVDLTAGDGSSALLWASYGDDEDAVDWLLQAGSDPNLANDLGATPLWAASQNGSDRIVRRLLRAGADPDAALLSGETPLMVAARSGAAAVTATLLEAGADIDHTATRHQTALMWAVAEKHPDVVAVLIDHGADLHIRSEVWSEVMAVPPHSYDPYNMDVPHGGNTALMFASRIGDLDSARLLVAAGADVDDQNAWGVSAMTMAEHSGFSELVRFLLAEGADPNEAGPGFNALHLAVMRRDEALVADLLAHGADPDIPIGTWTPERRSSVDLHLTPELIGATSYWLAAKFREPGIMRLLADHGADTRVVHRGEYVMAGYTEAMLEPQANETTALMAALGMGRGDAWVPARGDTDTLTLEAVRLAIELGTDVNVTDTDGRTALDAASRMRIEGLTELLTDAGAEPGVAPPEGGRGGRGEGRGAVPSIVAPGQGPGAADPQP